MKLSIEQNDLNNLLARVIGAVNKRNTIPILNNVKLVAGIGLTAVSTDLDIEVTATQKADVTKTGETTVAGQTLFDIVKKIPKGALISLEHDGQYLHVQAGRSKFKLATLDAHDFPVMANSEYSSRIVFDGLEFKNALDKTIWAASSEETRYYLNGALMQWVDGRVTFTATDGHRLAHYKDGNADQFPDVIIPTSAVKQFMAALDDGEATLDVSDTKIRLSYGDVVIVSKVIDGTYPDWTRVIPKGNSNEITLSSVDAKAAIERVTVVATEKTRAVKFKVADGELELSVVDANGGSAVEYLAVSQDGDGVEIGFNSKYALDSFKQAEQGSVTIRYGSSSDPVLVEYEKEEGLTVVVMPMRV